MNEVRPDKAKIDEPVAWLHTMWMEFGQFTTRITSSYISPFGIPGKDHSEHYPVTAEPLYRRKIIKKPRVVVR